MPTYLLPSFIRDLHEQADANFARRVFRKLFDADGVFRIDGDDHRYHGIDNAWIRYVSQGSSAFRVIFIRDGEDVRIYRAGPHSVENNLAPPSSDAKGVEVSADMVLERAKDAVRSEPAIGRLVSSLRTPSLSQLVLARRLIPHKEVTLVSPFLTNSMLGPMQKVGRLLDDFIEDGAKVTLITRPPTPNDLDFFKGLEARGVDLFFNHRLHSKLYVFTLDRARQKHGSSHEDLIVLGSANLTESGFWYSRERGNEELCFDLPTHHSGDIDSYLAYLSLNSDDLLKVRQDFARTERRRT